ncbi:hypothetical protein TNCV_1242391 [Trichonephila clavipes]|nr:hypothetical protein TNCV_1242391 [Trichonephila clavipes]
MGPPLPELPSPVAQVYGSLLPLLFITLTVWLFSLECLPTPNPEVHEQMSESGGQPEARPPVFKSPSKLATDLSTHCSMNEKLSRPWPARE